MQFATGATVGYGLGTLGAPIVVAPSVAPILYTIRPASGHTGGGQLVTLSGANFRMPPPPPRGPRIHGPWPANAGLYPGPAPTVGVWFGSDMVPADQVAVLHPGILQCLTPSHDPSGLPYVEPTANRPGQAAVPPSDVTVANLDDNGDPIPGQSFTLPAAYSFLRPDLTIPGVAATVIAAAILDLQRQILPNIEFNPHTDYDPDSGDFLNLPIAAALPALCLINLKMPQADQGRPRFFEEEVTVSTPAGYAIGRLAVMRDLVFTFLGVSDSQSELLGLQEALEVYFRRTGGVTVLRNADDPSLGTVTFPFYRETDTTFTGRIGSSNVVAFTFTARILSVPFADMPGLPADSIAAGATFDRFGLIVQSTQ